IAFVNGLVTISNSTLAGNSASAGTAIGGAILISGNGSLTISNSTIASNTAATQGGGLALLADISTPSVGLDSTVVAKNTGGVRPDLFTTSASPLSIGGDNNLIGLANDPNIVLTGLNNQAGTVTPIDPLLEPLANNGGPTPTMRPLPGSP